MSTDNVNRSRRVNYKPLETYPRHDSTVIMSKPTANWEKVGDKFYRKTQLYAAVFDQDLELENYNVVGAPYSGAVGRYAARRRDAVHGTVA